MMTNQSEFVRPVPLDRVYRILNIGPTVIVSGKTENDFDAMAAAWNTALDLDPAVVITLDEPLHEAHRERTTALSLDPDPLNRAELLSFRLEERRTRKDRPERHPLPEGR